LGGTPYLDIRRFVKKNGCDELIPTGRGISLPPERVAEIIALMQEENLEEATIEL